MRKRRKEQAERPAINSTPAAGGAGGGAEKNKAFFKRGFLFFETL